MRTDRAAIRGMRGRPSPALPGGFVARPVSSGGAGVFATDASDSCDGVADGVAAVKASFLEAGISMVSPVTGLRPKWVAARWLQPVEAAERRTSPFSTAAVMAVNTRPGFADVLLGGATLDADTLD